MYGKCLKSLYRHEGQFFLKILDEAIMIPTGFEGHEEPCYKVQCYEGQGFRTDISWLRKSLIGILYEIVDIPKQFKQKQLTIFDFI